MSFQDEINKAIQARRAAIGSNLSKGRKGSGAPIGTIKEMGGRNYIKAADGTWKYHSKGKQSEVKLPSPTHSQTLKTEQKVVPPVPKGQTASHGLQSYDLGRSLTRVGMFENFLQQRGIEGYDFRHKMTQSQKDKIQEEFDQLHGINKSNNNIAEILGLKNFEFETTEFSIRDAKEYISSKKTKEYNIDYINDKTKFTANFLTTNKTFQQTLKELDDFCTSSDSRVTIKWNDVKKSSSNGPFVVNLEIGRKWESFSNSNTKAPSVKLQAIVSNDGVHFFGLEEALVDHVDMMKRWDADQNRLTQLKYLKKVIQELDPSITSSDSFDESWIALKEQTERSSSRDIYKQLTKVDPNTVHLTIGHVGKKNPTHDTIRSAAAQIPPQSIGPYKLVSETKVVDNDNKMVDKQKTMKELLKNNDNKYSEYENNFDFTYVYKK